MLAWGQWESSFTCLTARETHHMSLESVSQLGWFRGHWLHSTFCAKLDLCQVFLLSVLGSLADSGRP